MNKKGILQFGAPVIILIIFILVFIVSTVSGFKIFSILKDIPEIVWYGIIIIVLWRLFSKSK